MNRKTNFFVVGLPRSRTAWMANFLTYDDHYCYHEAINGCKSMDEYKEKLGNFIGDSSTSLMLMDIEKNFPDSKIVKIVGNLDQSIASSKKIYPEVDEGWISFLDDQLYDMKSGINGNTLTVNINKLDSCLPWIWTFLFGTAVDHERLDTLLKFRIQVLDPKAFDEEALKSFFDVDNNNFEV